VSKLKAAHSSPFPAPRETRHEGAEKTPEDTTKGLQVFLGKLGQFLADALWLDEWAVWPNVELLGDKFFSGKGYPEENSQATAVFSMLRSCKFSELD
jgi:hypothetical protein